MQPGSRFLLYIKWKGKDKLVWQVKAHLHVKGMKRRVQIFFFKTQNIKLVTTIMTIKLGVTLEC